ncbi:MAG: hypothetical protein HS130_05445 [Deltaproteobacteria bacterium]|nr:hypothetical protein [Deltaproteobacteria bacterium]MCL4873240.1 hypothetical protein [bacterium]
MKKHIGIAILVLASAGLFTGCVSKSAYEGRVAILLEQLHRERMEKNAEIQLLETKVRERGRTLSGLTEMYMKIKDQNDTAQEKLGGFEGDLNALQNDLSELKLIVYSNLKGSQANEMILKLNEMQRRIQAILEKGAGPAREVPIESAAEGWPEPAQLE